MLVPTPEGMQIDDRDGVLTLKRRWFSPVHVFTLVFSLFWNGFLVVWYGVLSTTVASADVGLDSMLMGAALFPLIHVAVGLGLFYYSIAGFVNATTITVSYEKLTLVHGPLPWPGNKSLDSHEVKQIYVQEVVSSTKNGTSVGYTIKAILRDHREITFQKGVGDKGQALYIEKKIEEKLSLQDQAVLGEVDK